ncbi:hypothetical protein BSLG_010668 [Batrachochytrium salamandrivorans]|nr:hypothetical protein BSLG_010668 [Batrachochytrium salamandrivorans]
MLIRHVVAAGGRKQCNIAFADCIVSSRLPLLVHLGIGSPLYPDAAGTIGATFTSSAAGILSRNPTTHGALGLAASSIPLKNHHKNMSISKQALVPAVSSPKCDDHAGVNLIPLLSAIEKTWRSVFSPTRTLTSTLDGPYTAPTTSIFASITKRLAQSHSLYHRKHNTAQYYFASFGALVFGIVVIGGLTRLIESGLSIVEWNLIKATMIGFQGLLGWYMVKSGLSDTIMETPHAVPRVSHYWLCAHLGSAFAIYSVMLMTGLNIIKANRILTLKNAQNALGSIIPPRSFRTSAKGTACLVFLTALSGALVAGLDAGLIYNEYHMGPSTTGRSLRDRNKPILQFFSLWIASRRVRLPRTSRLATNVLLGVAVAQVSLGITTLIYLVPSLCSAQSGSLMLLTWLQSVVVPIELFVINKKSNCATYFKVAKPVNQRFESTTLMRR